MGGRHDIAELTRTAFECWNARDFDGLLELFHEDGIWEMTPAGIPGMGEYRGHEAIRGWFEQWLEVFPDSDVVVQGIEVRGDWGLVTVVQYASGGASGAPAPFAYFGVGHWRDGRLTFVENHMEEAGARGAFARYARNPETPASRLTD